MGTSTSPGPSVIHVGVGDGGNVGFGEGVCWRVGMGMAVYTSVSVGAAARVAAVVGLTARVASPEQPVRRPPAMNHRRSTFILGVRRECWLIWDSVCCNDSFPPT
jgi:hypothetical protein